MKPTKEQMFARAYGIVESYFYADDECEHVWEALEDVDETVLIHLVRDMAESIYRAMLWAQGDQTDE